MNHNRQVLSTSMVNCAQCGTSHRSVYETVDGQVLYSIECPLHPTQEVVSSDAAIFTAMRDYHESTAVSSGPCPLKYHFYVAAITDQCNFKCPICFAESGPDGRQFLSVEQLREAAMLVKADGGKRLSLSGGEPTMHPGLIEMVRVVRQEIGLSPILVTNGLRIADDIDFLRALKAVGLRRVHLQFDTLDSGVYRSMRGRPDVSEKLRAIEHVLSAGLRLGLVTTVCELNLRELGRLLEYSQQLVPALRIHVFQPAVPVGRYPEQLKPVTREEVIRTLVTSASKYVLRETDFRPFPVSAARRGVAHPDCSAHVLMCSDGTSSHPIAVESWESSQFDGAKGSGLAAADVLPCRTVATVKNISRGRWHPFFVSIIGFMRPPTRDNERLARCVVASVSDGYLAPLCERGCSFAKRGRRPK